MPRPVGGGMAERIAQKSAGRITRSWNMKKASTGRPWKAFLSVSMCSIEADRDRFVYGSS